MGRSWTLLTVRPCPLWAKQHAGFSVVQKQSCTRRVYAQAQKEVHFNGHFHNPDNPSEHSTVKCVDAFRQGKHQGSDRHVDSRWPAGRNLRLPVHRNPEHEHRELHLHPDPLHRWHRCVGVRNRHDRELGDRLSSCGAENQHCLLRNVENGRASFT